jgi:hypothetical protein
MAQFKYGEWDTTLVQEQAECKATWASANNGDSWLLYHDNMSCCVLRIVSVGLGFTDRFEYSINIHFSSRAVLSLYTFVGHRRRVAESGSAETFLAEDEREPRAYGSLELTVPNQLLVANSLR